MAHCQPRRRRRGGGAWGGAIGALCGWGEGQGEGVGRVGRGCPTSGIGHRAWGVGVRRGGEPRARGYDAIRRAATERSVAGWSGCVAPELVEARLCHRVVEKVNHLLGRGVGRHVAYVDSARLPRLKQQSRRHLWLSGAGSRHCRLRHIPIGLALASRLLILLAARILLAIPRCRQRGLGGWDGCVD